MADEDCDRQTECEIRSHHGDLCGADGQLQLDGFVLDITRNRAREKQIEGGKPKTKIFPAP